MLITRELPTGRATEKRSTDTAAPDHSTAPTALNRWVHLHKFATQYAGLCKELLEKYEKDGVIMKKFDHHDLMVEKKNRRSARRDTKKHPNPVGMEHPFPTELLAPPKKSRPYIG